MSEPQIITVHTLQEYGQKEWSAEDFLRLVHEAVEGIPKEFHGSALVKLKGDYDESCKLIVSYQRRETPEEVAERDAQYAAWERESEERERAEYERLRAKFGQS